MTSTGPGPATATDTSHMHAVFCLKKPIIGGLVQIKSDSHAAWIHLTPSSLPKSAPCSTTPVFMNGAKVWKSSFQKKKETCLIFNVNYSDTSKIQEWTPSCTLRIWEIPPRW